MGAGGSSAGVATDLKHEMDVKQALLDLEKQGFKAGFGKIDTDGSGEIDKQEFGEIMHTLGFGESEASVVDELFTKYDTDGNGKLSVKEFIVFCNQMVEKEHVSVEVPEDTSTIIPLLGPSEAAHGFRRALAVLDINPAAASIASGTGYLPLHILLMMDPTGGANPTRSSAAAAAVACQHARSLIKKLLEIHPEGAQARVMKGMQYPEGHLPLFLAASRNWDVSVVRAVAEAYPDGLRVLDPLKEEKKKPKAVNLKKCRWARKIAEEAEAKPAVLLLLPKPTKKKKDIVWIEGSECADEDGGGGGGKADETRGAKKA